MKPLANLTAKSRRVLAALLLVLAAAALAACGSSDGDGGGGSTSASGDGGTRTVTLGVLPFMDYQPWYVAHELGLDRERGYDLEFKQFPLEPNEIGAQARGDIDVGQGALGSLIPQLPQRRDLRVFLNEAQFRGFAFVARRGELRTFDELLAENGGDEDAARRATLTQLRGKQLVTLESSFKATIAAALREAGLSYDDVDVTNFDQSSAAAVSFIRGDGDVFMGGLPETIRLVSKRPDEYETLIGAEDMGPAGLWYSNAFVTDEYLQQNRDQLLDLMAIWYRTMRYLAEDPARTYPIMLRELNAQSSAELTVEDLREQIPDFTYFPTLRETGRLTYDPAASGYWKRSADYLIAQNEEQGTIPEGSANPDEFVVEEQMYRDLLANRELVDWIDSPLG